MTTEKKLRADRRLGRLIEFFEGKLSATSEKVQTQASDRLAEILLAQLQLKAQREERADRAAERELRKLELLLKAKVPVAEPAKTAPAPKDEFDDMLAQLKGRA